ncbi:LysR substrate-binding domain-containing protein [Agarilytica rhodophyticola]|uniref:LysR substrate-binding domain-containing protein n=1 Tax=Agarilytica rhodophyticola TaxID=1737490 RepID=UPI000B346B02|nr:LysR substrate-binding domain-containing protein [Agarilytica rhodophyticola]
MRYTLRQLEIFLATAHHQNVTKAAEELSMSQSAASGALKDLETQFDVQLFDRVGKRLQTNEFGNRVRIRAEALLAQAKELEHELSQHDKVGHIKVGATLTIGNYLCVDLIKQYIRESPGTQVKLEVANTESIARAILNFDIDLGLVEGELHHPDLDIVNWRKDSLICFCSPSHPLAQKTHITDKDLLAAKWILREPGSGTRQTFDRAMSGLTPSLDIELELQHTEAIKRAVENGLGISCLSEIALQTAFDRKTLVPINIPSRDFTRHFYFVIHKHKYRAAGILKWMGICNIDFETIDKL